MIETLFLQPRLEARLRDAAKGRCDISPEEPIDPCPPRCNGNQHLGRLPGGGPLLCTENTCITGKVFVGVRSSVCCQRRCARAQKKMLRAAQSSISSFFGKAKARPARPALSASSGSSGPGVASAPARSHHRASRLLTVLEVRCLARQSSHCSHTSSISVLVTQTVT